MPAYSPRWLVRIMAYLQQTPSHVGIVSNLMADALAKPGTNLLQPEFTVTLISPTK
jgi:hypothetical protein